MLISHYNSINDQLRVDIELDRDIDVIQFLDLQLQKMLTALKEYRAIDREEAHKHLLFFLGDLEQRDNSLTRQADVAIVAQLLHEYMLPDSPVQTIPAYCDVAALINNSSNRISLIDLDHRYQYTSRSNAANYGCSPDEISGQHVSEVIGDDRFKGRAKSFFDRCFGGEVVEYAHVLDESNSDTTTYMKCRMQPHFDVSGSLHGAIVTMSDISRELLLGVDGIDLEPVAPVAGIPHVQK
ncbi:MAG: PAS domain-containing protein [Rhizobiaceae bacterium]|nr:PAS domain-containing protein [Rhizobiaceae bacterium]